MEYNSDERGDFGKLRKEPKKLEPVSIMETQLRL